MILQCPTFGDPLDRDGRPTGIFMCWVFGRYPIFAVVLDWVLGEGFGIYMLISNGWGLCADQEVEAMVGRI